MLVRLLCVLLCCCALVANASTVLEAEWHFDEFDWTGQAGEVVDFSGSNHVGQSNGFLYSTVNGAVCGAADLTSNSDSDYFSLNNGALNGAMDFSIAYWAKLPTSVTPGQTQTLLSGVTGSASNGLRIEFVNINGQWRFQLAFNGAGSVLLDYFPNDDTWHHFVWTRHVGGSGQPEKVCVYVDGNALSCTDPRQNGQINIDAGGLIVGQSQTAVAGGFSTDSDWEGFVDELLVFRSELTSTEVADIYQRYQAGQNWDGSARSCPAPFIPNARGDWHLDKLSWVAAIDEVTDYSGNGFDGQSNIAMDTSADGVVCRAADFNADPTTDYLSLDAQAFNGLNDFTYSTWVRTVEQTDQALISLSNDSQDNEFLLLFDSSNFLHLYFRGTYYDFPGSVTFDDNQWHHFVMVRSGDQMCLYFDGERFGCVTVDSVALVVSSGGAIIGQEQDSLGGGFDPGQAWDGDIDEPLLFSSALTHRQVAQIYFNQQGGFNYDGTSRRCSLPPTVLDYRFDTCNWSDGQDVVDSGPNSLDAFAVNGVLSTIDGKICGLAEFDSINDYVTLPDSNLIDLPDQLTVTSWVRINSTPPQLGSILSKDTNYEFHVNSNLQIFWWWIDAQGVNGTLTSTVQLSLNQWHQVAIIYQDGLQQIFIDGEEAGRNTLEGQLITNSNELQIGQDQGISDRFFDGDIDEVKIFDVALTEFELRDIYNNENAGKNFDGGLRACNCVEPNRVDHYSISHAGSLVSCMATDIRIQAHDDNHAVVNARDRAITITASSGKGDWLGVVSGGGVLSNSSAGQVVYTFPDNGESEVVLSFAYPDLASDPEVVNFNVADGESTDLRDSANAEDLSLEVSDSGFIFDVPDTESCLSSTVVRLRAVRKSDSSASCVAAVSGSQDVDFLSQYIVPNTGEKPVLISALSTEYSLVEGVVTPVTLDFDANGEAEFTASYYDAGQLLLSASLIGSVNRLEGGDVWVAYPERLVVSASDVDGNQLHNSNLVGGAVWQASRPFYLTVSAQCADSTLTPNYQPNSAQLSAQMLSPLVADGAASGQLGLVTGSISVADTAVDVAISSGFSGGVLESDSTYSEVGVISVSARDDSYFGHQIQPQSTSVGRFVPAFFDVFANTPVINAYCASGSFNYIDDWLGFQVAPQFTVRPRSYTGAVTYNYGASLWRLDSGFSERAYEDKSSTVDAAFEASLSGTGGSWQGSDEDFSGDAVSSLLDDEVRYTKGMPEAPFTGSFDVVLSIADLTDEDSVCYKRDSDSDSDWLEEPCEAFRLEAVDALPMRYGRLWLEDTYGPETEALVVPWMTQYFDGDRFVSNGLDSCSSWLESEVLLSDVEQNLIADDKSSLVYAYPDSDFRVEGGSAGVEMSAPGASFVGVIGLQVDMTRYPFLLWDRNNDGVGDAPEAFITFGQYRSHDRVIFQRQN